MLQIIIHYYLVCKSAFRAYYIIWYDWYEAVHNCQNVHPANMELIKMKIPIILFCTPMMSYIDVGKFILYGWMYIV